MSKMNRNLDLSFLTCCFTSTLHYLHNMSVAAMYFVMVPISFNCGYSFYVTRHEMNNSTPNNISAQ